MKKILILSIMIFTMSSCSNNNQQQKEYGNNDLLKYEQVEDIQVKEQEQAQVEVKEQAQEQAQAQELPLTYKEEMFDDILEVVTEHAQTGKTLEDLGVEIVEPNWNYDEFYELSAINDELAKEIEYHRERGTPYILDFDGDGLLEAIAFDGIGAIPYNPVNIFHLDENMNIVDSEIYHGKYETKLYKYNEKYFFVSNITDLSEKWEHKLRIYAINENKPFVADVIYETIGYELDYTENIMEHNFSYDLIDSYIDNLENLKNTSEYNTKVYYTENFEINDEILEEYGIIKDGEDRVLINDESYIIKNYNLIDMNNDGYLDLVLQEVITPAGVHISGLHFMLFAFVDGKTKDIVNISMLDNWYDLSNIDMIEQDGENYFILLSSDLKEHTFKLVKFEGTNMQVLEKWHVVNREKIVVKILDKQN